MIAPKDRVQEVKQIVAQLKESGRSEADVHRKAYRPWGHYDLVDSGERHQTKRIVVKPGGKLSVQKTSSSRRTLGCSQRHSIGYQG